MKLIDRYVGGQLLLTFSIAVTVLSVVLVFAGNIFESSCSELLVKNDTPLDLVLSFLAYILPFSLSFTIPWGFLTAVLLVFGKMSAENELIAFRANGVSVPRLCASVLVLAIDLRGDLLLDRHIDVAPRAQKKMKEALYNIATSNPLAMFGADRIIDSFPNKKIYVESNHGPELSNLLVYELNDGRPVAEDHFRAPRPAGNRPGEEGIAAPHLRRPLRAEGRLGSGQSLQDQAGDHDAGEHPADLPGGIAR